MDDCSAPEEVEDDLPCLAGLSQICDKHYLQWHSPSPATQFDQKNEPQPAEKPVTVPLPIPVPDGTPTEPLPAIPLEPIIIPRGIQHEGV